MGRPESELKRLISEHRTDVELLRAKCKHPPNMIIIRLDYSSVGLSSGTPTVHVVCTNCGAKKIICGLDSKQRHKVRKTLKRQGFKDERTGCFIQHDWELDRG